MIRCCIVDTRNNSVVNVVEYGVAPVGAVPGFDNNYIAVAHDAAQIGWTWNGVTLSDPVPAPIPPTSDEIKDAQINSIALAVFKIAFNHENRIRALEGKAAITAAQFKTALRTVV